MRRIASIVLAGLSVGSLALLSSSALAQRAAGLQQGQGWGQSDHGARVSAQPPHRLDDFGGDALCRLLVNRRLDARQRAPAGLQHRKIVLVALLHLLGELEHREGVRVALLERLELVHLALEAGFFLRQASGLAVVVPEFGLLGEVVEFGNASRFDRKVKATP